MKDPEQVDALEMVRAIRDRQYEILKDESAEERRQFYAEQARRLHKRLQGTLPGGGATAAEGNE